MRLRSLVPNVAAFRRHHADLRRRASLAAIAGGVALFAIASLTTATAATHPAGRPPRQRPGPASYLPTVPALAAASSAPAEPRTLARKPTHVTKPAPVTHGVISGLAANGIPAVALNAYRVAAARMADVEPGCRLDWALLAGIGREESDHGRFAGATLHADGVSTPRIIGPALDGVRWDYIPAPGNGLALAGDAVYAHALGPMQFIPSTWAIYGADANGDGRADVFNINDAALGAARYLCAAGGDLGTHAGQVRSVLAYNHSDEYLAQVLALADAYRRGIPITGIPVGITTGPLPAITDTGYIPPANPAAPPAARRGTTRKHATKHPAMRQHRAGSPTRTATTPKPGTASSGPGTSGSRPGTSRTPTGGAASSSSPPPTRAGTSSTPPPSKTSSPTPSPSTNCNVLDHLLGKC